jgi:hypothetical protein
MRRSSWGPRYGGSSLPCVSDWSGREVEVCEHCEDVECVDEACVAHLGFQFVDLFTDSTVEQSDRESLKATTLEDAVAEMMTKLSERPDWFFEDDEEKTWTILDRNWVVWSARLRSPLGSMVRP